jgi:ATP-dependent 26S proteasome regulatory subunit
LQGSGVEKIKEIFQNARKKSPSIIFFDEFDSVAGDRSMDQDGVITGVLN